jgi:hypothetical protein
VHCALAAARECGRAMICRGDVGEERENVRMGCDARLHPFYVSAQFSGHEKLELGEEMGICWR